RGFGGEVPYLDPSQALATLALTIDARGSTAGIADGIGTAIAQWMQYRISPVDLANDVAALVSAHTITAAHAFSLLAPIAAHGDTDLQGCVGHVLGTMLADGQITTNDIHRAITSHALPVDVAVVVLTSMTEQGSATATNVALSQLSWMVTSNLIS